MSDDQIIEIKEDRKTPYQHMIMAALMRRSHSLYWGSVPKAVIAKRRNKNRVAKQSRKANR